MDGWISGGILSVWMLYYRLDYTVPIRYDAGIYTALTWNQGIKMFDWFLYSGFYRWLRNAYWYIQHNFNPRHRYHMLDLRQPITNSHYCYRYGWLDADNKMVYALFNILNRFVEREMPDYYIPTEEETKGRPDLKGQREAGLEILSIHNWWNITRPAMEAEHQKELAEWSEMARPLSEHRRSPEIDALLKRLDEMEAEYNKQLEEYMIRLIRIRSWMWT